MAQRVTQDATLGLSEGTPNQRVTEVANMVLGEGPAAQRVIQLAVLVLADVSMTPASGTTTPIIFCST